MLFVIGSGTASSQDRPAEKAPAVTIPLETPEQAKARHAKVAEASVTLNYTTVLNVIFLGLAAILVVRFLRTGGRQMLAMMDRGPEEMHMEMGSPE